MPEEFLLPHLFCNTVKIYKNKIALITNNIEYTYQEIYSDAIFLSKFLKSKGIDRHQRVIVQAGNSYLSIVAFWSILICEATVCMINSETCGKALDFLINDIKPTIVIASDLSVSQIDSYASNRNELIGLIFKNEIDVSCFFEKNDSADNNFDQPLKLKQTELDLALIIYTSGSTGNPKGVMMSHHNVISAIKSISTYLKLTNEDITLSVLPLHFDYGLYQLLLSFSIGSTLVLDKNMFLPMLILKKINQYKITILPCAPTIIRLLYLCLKDKDQKYKSVIKITNTGERLTEIQIEQLLQMFPHAEIYSMYGLTECKRCSYVPPRMLAKKSDAIGIPMPNLEMWIQDKNGNKLGPNQEGEIVVMGPSVMQGYWNNIRESRKKISYDQFGNRFLLTGDVGLMDEEGYFYFKGRNDEITKFNGIKFNPNEYVEKISRFKTILKVYIFVAYTINQQNSLIVCLEIKNISDFSHQYKSELRAVFPLSQQPTYLYFSEKFPILSNGKLDKHQLECLSKKSYESSLITKVSLS